MTAKEIISRSFAMHPSALIGALRNRADEDSAYAARCALNSAARGARASANAYTKAAEFLEREDLSVEERIACIVAETGPAVVTLNMACKLLCLPPHVRTAAAVGLDD